MSFIKFWLCVYIPVLQFCLDFLLLKESKIGVNTVRFQILIPKPLLPWMNKCRENSDLTLPLWLVLSIHLASDIFESLCCHQMFLSCKIPVTSLTFNLECETVKLIRRIQFKGGGDFLQNRLVNIYQQIQKIKIDYKYCTLNNILRHVALVANPGINSLLSLQSAGKHS